MTLDAQGSGSEHEMALELFPNPYNRGNGDLSISLNGIVDGRSETTIEIMRKTGEIIYSEKLFCDSRCNPYSFQVDALTPGVLLVRIISNDRTYYRRLLVK